MAEAEEEKQNGNIEQTASDTTAGAAAEFLASSKNEGEKKSSIAETYFSNGNRLLTLQGSSLVINDDTRRLLALFSDGRFLVVESHKFDGRVLSFEVLARKKRLAIQKPTYVSQNEINAIYSILSRIFNLFITSSMFVAIC